MITFTAKGGEKKTTTTTEKIKMKMKERTEH